MRRFCVLFLQIFLISFCSSELSVEKRDKLLNGFVDYFNNLPNQPYAYGEGILLNAQETDENIYNVEVRLKVSELHNLDSIKYLKCTGTVQDLGDSGTSVQNNNYHCLEAPDAGQEDLEEVVTDNTVVEHRPVQLDNEVQPDNTVTSGEQFIAIPREQPAPCIGCASHVDPQAAGVTELANLGIKQLDRHEPNARHSLNTVLDVERQVQVVNGVRYILTLTVDYDSCTPTNTEACAFQKTCKISILEKPWVKSPNGMKYRAIMANNCTEQWLFGDNGEVVSDPNANKENNEINVNPSDDNNDKTTDSQKAIPDFDKIAKTGSADDILKVVHQQLQLQPNQEKIFTDEEIKLLEEQIIPKDQIHELPGSNLESNTEEYQTINVNAEKVAKLENSNNISGKSVLPNTKQEDNNNSGVLTEDKKKALDDLMDFFKFAGLNSKNDDTDESPRMKRSYDSDLQAMTLAEKFKKLKSNIENSKYIYVLGQTMVDYLNEMDLEVKTRTLKSVLAAEEEFENHQHFFYIQALVTIPCDKAECESKDTEVKICNAIIDSSNQKSPQVLNSFCYNNEKIKSPLGKVSGVPLNDPVLLKLTNKAVKKIESELPLPNAMRVKKTLSANTQRVSGTLTKISFVLEFTSCNKSVHIVLRENCTILEDLGTKVCEVAIHERKWLNEQIITYTCTERPADASFVNANQHGMKKVKVNDPKVLEIAQEALQYLEVQSNRNKKQKIVEVKSVSTQLVAGLLTYVEFVVGYTTCPSNFDDTINKCELLTNEPLRKCLAQAWERPWLEDGRQVKVTCDGFKNNTDENGILHLRKKRQIYPDPEETTVDQKTRSNWYVGGQSDKDPSDPKYMTLAEESLTKYLKTSGTTQHHKVIQVVKATKQVVSGTLTRIKFTILPTNCQLDSNAKPTSENCVVQSSTDVITCDSEIWERPWLNSKEITVNCALNKPRTKRHKAGGILDNFNKPTAKRGIPGAPLGKDPSDPKYMTLAEESLNKYLKTSGVNQHHKVIQVVEATEQVVSGKLTKIQFTILPTNCQLDSNGKPTSENCVVQSSADAISCHSEIWERPWLNSKEITVNCEFNKPRAKRDIRGAPLDKDPSDPEFMKLAEESLNKYQKTTGTTQHHKVIEVVKATKQVVSGTLTRIKFTILPTNCQLDSNAKPTSENCVVQSSADAISCHSEIWERPWLNSKEITVNCDFNKPRAKRGIPGAPLGKDPNDPKFIKLAEESVNKYQKTSGAKQHHKVIQVVEATEQVVSGKLTKIQFTILPTNCQLDSNGKPTSENCVVQSSADAISCHSEIWERPWLNSKEITVNCDFNKPRAKRGIPGAPLGKDPNDPKFIKLAEESVNKYQKTSGAKQHHKVIQVVEATEQVVSGKLTKIQFTILPTNCQLDSNGKPTSENCVVQSSADAISCHSEIWERAWLNSKEITVNCDFNKPRTKRGIPGAQLGKDPSDPKFIKLAEESVNKYQKTSGAKQHHKVIQVVEATEQVVSGILTKIQFTILPTNCQLDSNGKPTSENCVVQSSADAISCHSEIWERSWLNSKEITVNCAKSGSVTRKKRDTIIGGTTDVDTNDENAKALADESLKKYLLSSGDKRVHKLVEIEHVTKQIVSGVITRIDFKISPTNCQIDDLLEDPQISCDIDSSQIIGCHSEVWERPWLKHGKLIDVHCEDLVENESETMEDDEDSNENAGIKYLNSTNEFDFMNIDQSVVHGTGGHEEQDASDPEYKIWAEKSLRKYQRLLNSNVHHEVIKVKRVSKQIVSGIKYTIDFTAAPTNCSINEFNTYKCKPTAVLDCYTVIMNRTWLKTEDIEVNCFNRNKEYENEGENHKNEDTKQNFGRVEEQDVSKEYYRILAEKALQKYQTRTQADYLHKVTKIKRVTEQVVSGFLTRIDFIASPTNCLISNGKSVDNCDVQDPKVTLRCFAEIFEAPKSTESIRVNCKVMKKKSTNKIGRNRRQLFPEDEYMDDETKYYYADRAISNLNDASHTENLFKIITVHDVQRSMHMNTMMIRMYLETAMTYCLRNEDDSDLSKCDEIEGLNHKLCLARLWPSPDDELVVKQVSVICDDTKEFEKISGVSMTELIKLSIAKLEQSPDIVYKVVHQGEPSLVPTLDYKKPIKLSFIIATTNCSKEIDIDKYRAQCFINPQRPVKACRSFVWLKPNSRSVQRINVECGMPKTDRKKRSISLDSANATADDLVIQKMVQESLDKLEMSSLHRYKQRVLLINSYSTKITTGKVTTIDFDVGYTTCLKYEWVENVTSCEFLEHLPRRHCVSQVWERLWLNNGRNIEVSCEDDETPLEAHIEFESAENAMHLAKEALKHIEAKYPHPRKQKVVRIFSLEKQVVAGLHYRMKIEVGLTDCMALSIEDNCKLVTNLGLNKFCRVNIWLRPWTDHPPNYRVTCDYQESATSEVYHRIQAERLFYNFLMIHKPEYLNNHEEMTRRFDIFRKNVRKIHELNIYERGTARYAVTKFTDLSAEEFSKKYLGLRADLRNENQLPMRHAEIPKIEIPEKFDWRDYGAVTEVKDQGSCGSCWAFSVTGNIEGQWKMQSGQLVSLSEQELVDCDKLDEGCNGGLPDNAYRAIEQMGGLEAENDYPYAGEDDACSFNKTLSRVQISGAVNITSNETDMAKWLVQNGPISIGINANAMQFYVGGVSHPWKMLCDPKNLDHGVLIVGYGVKDYPLFHKRLPYWIVKNSWGPSWGEQGYYRVYRGDGTCGVNQMASSAVI